MGEAIMRRLTDGIEKKTMRLTVTLGEEDAKALLHGMKKIGETNMSSYVRRLIHQNRGYDYAKQVRSLPND